MEDFEQLQIIFNFFKRGICYFSKHLSLLLLVPALLGGIWQIIELSQMSFSYIRFFSPGQVLADGLLLLILVIFFLGTFFFLRTIYNYYLNLISEDDSSDDDSIEIPSKTSYIKCVSLFLLYIILLLFEVYTLLNILKKPDSIFTILILLPVVTIILYLALAAWMIANLSIIRTWLYKNILRHTIWLWLITIVISFFLTASSFRKSFILPKNLVNTDIIVHQITEANPDSQPEIVYNNDKYLFIELNNFFYLHNKHVNRAMLIVPIEDIFHLSDVKYKLPDYNKAAYHFYKAKQKMTIRNNKLRKKQ